MQLPDQRTSQPGPRRRRHVALAATALALSLASIGCGPGPEHRVGEGDLLSRGAGRAAPAPTRFRSGVALARRAARAYAAGAYGRHAPVLPGETESVSAALAGAARRVPLKRRRLHPRLRWLRLGGVGPDRISAVASIGDGLFAPFTVGFELLWQDGWHVVAISLPD